MVKNWMANYTGSLLSSMATRLLLNLHDQVSRTAHYPAGSTVCEGHTNAFSTMVFAPLAVTGDVESALHDASGGRSSTDNKTSREDWNDEVNVFEMKTLERTDREESILSPGWVDSERMLAVPGRRQRGAVKVDPG
ncbi:hypothetical protein M407DRAFT_106213 [Tulasnella calospora MUT 4182]|uniref:Uncharacterized protein n=1 Tax=Tulasnella calospora MUT 4182 TaxID=1051891 RepID=A0A0C3KRA2_9AGAM|nr:hypothetical protein M407DRAFT_106213 [Tulasnella calospora MUT 4182]